jgi:two-component system phosphate regulon response regulator OmpR
VLWRPHILCVDDDKRLRELLRKYLMDHGYLVTTAHDANDAQAKLDIITFDIVVLDVMMPVTDGIRLTNQLRKQDRFQDLPILLLTARGEKDDRIAGLEAGSDDYLVKPFEPKELLLRIQSILKRVPKPQQNKEIWFGPIFYDHTRGELRSNNDIVRLSQVEAGLLKILAQKPGEVISRDILVEKSPVPINDRTVDVQVTRLRRKIEDDPKNPRYLQTVRGVGYMLAPD